MFVVIITVIWFILICDLLSMSTKQLSFDLVHILKITELLIMITSVGIDSQWEKSVVEYKWGVELKKLFLVTKMPISFAMQEQILLLVIDMITHSIPRRTTNLYTDLLLHLFNLKVDTNPHQFLVAYLRRMDVNELLRRLVEISIIRGTRFRAEIPDKKSLEGLLIHDPPTQSICNLLGQKHSQLFCDCHPTGTIDGGIYTCRELHTLFKSY